MIIFPAIDLKDGHCVRLRQGRADDATVYSDDPVAMARQWEDAGAEALHVVDLDGAFQGGPRHAELIARIVAAIRIPVQVGGGLRTDDDVARLLDAGARRAILGTRALDDPDALARLVARFGGGRIAVGIDARDGLVQVKGWVETSSTSAIDLAKRVESIGVRTLVYTDTATDGMLGGPNLQAQDEMCRAVSCQVIASGGVGSAADVQALAALGRPNLRGAIVGKALYDGRTTLAELLAVL
ncbi:MAG: 1-(5-phosphoribosyl)-5-[(5-phosphoribosylamino)methylideneamino]imidazole-4-carboxamide isomerase [Kiritimatiellia bacterium]|jgi:phosphoribosylformimino-5-aminoimidazole carboxamide ribotide isomerase